MTRRQCKNGCWATTFDKLGDPFKNQRDGMS